MLTVLGILPMLFYMILNDILKCCFSNLALPDICLGVHIDLNMSITQFLICSLECKIGFLLQLGYLLEYSFWA